MTTFASAADLEARLGITLTEAEQIRAESLLQLASGLIRDAVRQTISLVEDDELTLPGTNADRIALPERPVVSVASVTLDGNDVSFSLAGSSIFRRSLTVWDADFDRDGRWSRGFGRIYQTIVVTYTHGYAADEIPSLVKSICLEAAVRVWVNPGAVARESEGDTSVVYDNMRFSPSGLLLTDIERSQLKHFFGSRAANVSVG